MNRAQSATKDLTERWELYKLSATEKEREKERGKESKIVWEERRKREIQGYKENDKSSKVYADFCAACDGGYPVRTIQQKNKTTK